MGLSAASCVAVGVGLGVWADRSWHTAPALLMVGLATGVATAVLTVVKQIRNFL
jgi:F0F1-type ATP synthase assembly protein I